MKIPLNSIRQLVDIKLDKDELISKVFTQIGAVEEIIDLKAKYEGIIVATIKEKKDHPDSEKLGIYQVNIGNDQIVQVVAGDKTLEVGDKVAYFTVGTKLPYNPHPEKNDNVVTKVTLRGVQSEGMMASIKELDLGNDHTKVLRLDTDSLEGTSFSIAYGLDDLVLDIENKALANRADGFGLIGIAREIAAMQNIKYQSPSWYKDPKSNKPVENEQLQITVDNKTQINCPRYMAVILDNVEIKTSPLWLQVELSKVGIKSINNIVDITNYLMVLTSQPIHAFDYDKVVKKDIAHIVVRQAQNGEKLLGINDKVIELDDTMTVICDKESPIALAGVIGGKNTEVDENTKRIIVEVANFNRYNIRKTSWKSGIVTEASNRYTKALDPNQCESVLYKVASMATELAGATVASKVVDSYPNPYNPIVLKIDISAANKTIGLKLDKEQIKGILDNLEYKILKEEEHILEIEVPTFRQDVNIVEDVYEDIARVYGFNTIAPTLPTRSILPAPKYKMWDLKQQIRNILSRHGANELLTYNFVSINSLKNFNLDANNAYQLQNPLSPELSFMRINLIPSLSDKLLENINRGYTSQSLFEINIGHNKLELNDEQLPYERWNVSLLDVKGQKDETSSYYNSKYYIDMLEKELNLTTLSYTLLCDQPIDQLPIWIKNISVQYNQNRSAVIHFEKEGKKYYLGIVGELANTVKYNANLPKDISAFEIDIIELQNAIQATSSYQEPSRFPKISQDICFVLNKDIQFRVVNSVIEDILKGSKMYYEIELIDIYSSDKQPETKQMTFRITLQSRDKTLESWEFDKVKKKVIYLVSEKFQAKVI